MPAHGGRHHVQANPMCRLGKAPLCTITFYLALTNWELLFRAQLLFLGSTFHEPHLALFASSSALRFRLVVHALLRARLMPAQAAVREARKPKH